jgi:opacity protein-like surface antigen
MIGVGLVPALAADASTPLYKTPPAASSSFSWTGCYVGVEAGGAWGQSQQIAATAPNHADVGLPITVRFNLAGALAGGTVGCNYQISSMVLGVENDLSWTNKGASSPDIPPFSRGAISSTSEKWIDTLRGRVGWAWDRFLVYGTAGAALTGVDVGVCSPTAICISDTRTRTGRLVGSCRDRNLENRIFACGLRRGSFCQPADCGREEYLRQQECEAYRRYCPRRIELEIQLVNPRRVRSEVLPASAEKVPVALQRSAFSCAAPPRLLR